MRSFLLACFILLNLVAASVNVVRPRPKRGRSFFEFETRESFEEESDATLIALMSVNHLLGETETPVAHNLRYLKTDEDDTDDEEEEEKEEEECECESENNVLIDGLDPIHFDSIESFYNNDEDQENIPPPSSRSFMTIDQSQSNYNDPFQFAAPNFLEKNFENNQMEQPAEPSKPAAKIPDTLNRQPRCRVSSCTATLMLLDLKKNMEDLDYLRGSN